MDDLTNCFPNCTLTTEEIRETIRKVLGMTEDQGGIYYFCYKCFRYLGINTPKGNCCRRCYQFYCKQCSIPLSIDRTGQVIDPTKCIQCLDNQLTTILNGNLLLK